MNKKHDNKINHLSYKKRKPPICQQKKRNFTQLLSPGQAPSAPLGAPDPAMGRRGFRSPARARRNARETLPTACFHMVFWDWIRPSTTWILISGKSRIASTWSWSSSSSSSSPTPSLSSISSNDNGVIHGVIHQLMNRPHLARWWTRGAPGKLIFQPLLPWPWLLPHNNVHSSTFVIRY